MARSSVGPDVNFRDAGSAALLIVAAATATLVGGCRFDTSGRPRDRSLRDARASERRPVESSPGDLRKDIAPVCSGTCSSGGCAGGCCQEDWTGSSLTCSKASCPCVFDCSGVEGTCAATCSGGATCFLDCSGSKECHPECTGSSTCYVDCWGNTDECLLKCTSSSCLLECGGAKGDCSISTCSTGSVKHCAGGIHVCGRDCPP